MKATMEIVKKWVQDAISDGWSSEPTYGKHESIETAVKLKKDGFQVSAIMRERPENKRSPYDVSINAWGPDGVCVQIPEVYSMADLVTALGFCEICGKKDVKTVRLAFANRACVECRNKPEVLKKYEYPGWCD